MSRSVTAIASLLVLVGWADPAPSPPDLTAEQAAIIEWAEGRFERAGLRLPEVTFLFHTDTEPCNWRRGLFHPASAVVEICHLNPDTMIHELAHAWVEANLTDDDKVAFLRHRGLEAWEDHSVPWKERGTEHAAEMIAWAVEERSRLVTWVEDDGTRIERLLTIDDSTPDRLAAGYLLITGSFPPGHLTVRNLVP